MSQRRFDLKVVLPIAALLFGMLGALGLVAASPSVATRAPERRPPLIAVGPLAPQSLHLSVETQGSVVPRTEIELVAEVSGRITEIAPGLASGGFFEAGEPLLRVDPSDYEIAVERAEASLARAESELELARSTRTRRASLAESGVASAAALDDARVRERVAEAARRDAEAQLTHARRELERTLVLAPFAGRVRDKNVDVGRFVSRGSPLARVYAVDWAEVRLPITNRDAAFVELPVGYRGDSDTETGPQVVLHASYAGREHTWQGRIVRTEGEIDARTRMIHAVARIEDPYGRGADGTRPPLAVGMFVNAAIRGVPVEDVLVVPRSALRGQDEIVVVDRDDRLRFRRIELVRRQRDQAVVRGALEPGDRVPLSELDVVVEGMQVRTAGRGAS